MQKIKVQIHTAGISLVETDEKDILIYSPKTKTVTAIFEYTGIVHEDGKFNLDEFANCLNTYEMSGGEKADWELALGLEIGSDIDNELIMQVLFKDFDLTGQISPIYMVLAQTLNTSIFGTFSSCMTNWRQSVITYGTNQVIPSTRRIYRNLPIGKRQYKKLKKIQPALIPFVSELLEIDKGIKDESIELKRVLSWIILHDKILSTLFIPPIEAFKENGGIMGQYTLLFYQYISLNFLGTKLPEIKIVNFPQFLSFSIGVLSGKLISTVIVNKQKEEEKQNEVK